MRKDIEARRAYMREWRKAHPGYKRKEKTKWQAEWRKKHSVRFKRTWQAAVYRRRLLAMGRARNCFAPAQEVDRA